MQPGVSMAAVAMAKGINANLLRRWVKDAEIVPVKDVVVASAPPASPTASFVPVQLPVRAAAAEIRIELKRGATAILVTWPGDAAAECAAWMRELLR